MTTNRGLSLSCGDTHPNTIANKYDYVAKQSKEQQFYRQTMTYGDPQAITFEVIEDQSTHQLSVKGYNGKAVQTAEITNTFKPDKPGFDKKIKDTNDSTGETSDWQDSADYDIGDAVPYKLTATLAKDVTAYKKYHITFTDKMDISKVDAQAKALAGAEFKLEKLDKNEKVLYQVGDAIGLAGVKDNVFTFTGLDDGIYRLTETKAPDGYNPIDPLTFTVTAEHGATWDYTSDAKADPAFSPDSRNSILTALTGEEIGNETTGMLTLTANSDLSALEGSVINSKEGGNLAVKKKVSSTRSEDKTRNYGFKVTLGDKTINGKYGDMEFKDGVATFTLKDNETKRAASLPLNEKGELKYEVVETDAGGLTSTMGKPVKTKDGLTHTVTCINTYKKPTTSSSRSSTARTGDSTNYAAVGVLAAAGVAILAGALINKCRRSK